MISETFFCFAISFDVKKNESKKDFDWFLTFAFHLFEAKNIYLRDKLNICSPNERIFGEVKPTSKYFRQANVEAT